MSKDFLKDFKGTVYGYCVSTDYGDGKPPIVDFGTYAIVLDRYREISPFIVGAVKDFNASNPNSYPIVKARREYLSDRVVTVTPARTVNGVWTSDYEASDYEVSK